MVKFEKVSQCAKVFLPLLQRMFLQINIKQSDLYFLVANCRLQGLVNILQKYVNFILSLSIVHLEYFFLQKSIKCN